MNSLLLYGALSGLSILPFHICDNDDQQYTTRYNGAFQVSYDWVQHKGESVAQVGGCSSTLIDEGVIITAAHCRLKIGDTVKFNYILDNDDYERYQISGVLEKSGWDLDYAIYQLDGKPDFPIRELTEEVPDIGDEVYLIGHPQRRRLTVSGGPLVGKSGRDAKYRADSLGGSSGSGVLDGKGRMFAVHQRGSCHSRGMGYNLGTKIEKIKERSPIVRRLLGN